MIAARFVVAPQEAGERLDVVLARRLGEPRNQAAARIRRGEVSVGGRRPAKSLRLDEGQQVEVAAPVAAPTGADGRAPPLVRWEDEHLLVVAKTAGTVVHPGAGSLSGTLVQALVEGGYRLAPAGGPQRPGIVHRLDRGTSGLLAVAKTDEAYRGLVRMLSRREVDRGYLALVDGAPPATRGRVEAPIGRDPRRRTRFAVVRDGKPATTHWAVRAPGSADGTPVTLLACRLGTGRTHQIRVHLAHAGHPVSGDRVYGADRAIAAALGLARPFLHAARLAFDHPVTGEPVEVIEPLTTDLRSAADRAGVSPAAEQAVRTGLRDDGRR
ncbi:MAG TPA: RluA family pseudouridine synthase [Nitriliruptorales bacterium]|nr:RluA family pseudouridine synthase [Nitriliruptorales bacterium]